VTPQPGSLAVEARASNGGRPTAATVHLVEVERELGERLRRAAIFLVIGCLGLVLLPVPGVHFFGVAVFVAGLAVAVRRAGPPIVVGGAEGACPACGHAAHWFAGAGWRPVRWPLVTSCPSCKVELRLTPAP
jgi:hypothetical protein